MSALEAEVARLAVMHEAVAAVPLLTGAESAAFVDYAVEHWREHMPGGAADLEQNACWDALLAAWRAAEAAS